MTTRKSAWGLTVGCMLVLGLLVLGVNSSVAAAGDTVPEVFRATTTNMTPAGLGLKVDVLRWSSAEEREAALAALQAGDESLQELPTVGYVWPDDSGLGYSIKYARRIETPDGGEHITLVTGRPLGTFSREPWAVEGAAAPARDYTVIAMRLDEEGQGSGTMSLAADVTIDGASNVVALEHPEQAPVLLEDVLREPLPYWARRE